MIYTFNNDWESFKTFGAYLFKIGLSFRYKAYYSDNIHLISSIHLDFKLLGFGIYLTFYKLHKI